MCRLHPFVVCPETELQSCCTQLLSDKTGQADRVTLQALVIGDLPRLAHCFRARCSASLAWGLQLLR